MAEILFNERISCNGKVTPAYKKQTNIGQELPLYYEATVSRDSGVTRIRTQAFDVSLGAKPGQVAGRGVAFYAAISGQLGTDATAGGSIQMFYLVRAASGATWYRQATPKLITAGTSISGTSGAHYDLISDPRPGSQWALELAFATSRVTRDLEVDCRLVAE